MDFSYFEYSIWFLDLPKNDNEYFFNQMIYNNFMRSDFVIILCAIEIVVFVSPRMASQNFANYMTINIMLQRNTQCRIVHLYFKSRNGNMFRFNSCQDWVTFAYFCFSQLGRNHWNPLHIIQGQLTVAQEMFFPNSIFTILKEMIRTLQWESSPPPLRNGFL